MCGAGKLCALLARRKSLGAAAQALAEAQGRASLRSRGRRLLGTRRSGGLGGGRASRCAAWRARCDSSPRAWSVIAAAAPRGCAGPPPPSSTGARLGAAQGEPGGASLARTVLLHLQPHLRPTAPSDAPAPRPRHPTARPPCIQGTLPPRAARCCDRPSRACSAPARLQSRVQAAAFLVSGRQSSLG